MSIYSPLKVTWNPKEKQLFNVCYIISKESTIPNEPNPYFEVPDDNDFVETVSASKREIQKQIDMYPYEDMRVKKVFEISLRRRESEDITAYLGNNPGIREFTD